MEKAVELSVIVPILNEERGIETCVRSLLEQDFPHDSMELLLVDGGSSDRTPELLKKLQAENPEAVRVLQNPKRIQAAAVNLGAQAARGTYLMRVDAHAEYPKNYFSKCVSLLKETDARNVGCLCTAKGNGKTGKRIAMLLASPFGVGGSGFRVGARSGYTDTVPFGTFRRDYFLEIGGFDERLVRSEDNEINYRIRKSGGKIYLTDEMEVTYFCRETVRSLAQMAFANGKWNVIAAKLCPGSMSLKYFVPLAFVLSLVLMPLLCPLNVLFRWVFAAELALYFGLCLYFSLQKTHSFRDAVPLCLLFPAFHISYGAGSLAGIALLPKYGGIHHERRP